MEFDEVLLLPKPCSTRKAPRRSDERKARGTCTTPESLRPADGMVTAYSVIGVLSVVTPFQSSMLRLPGAVQHEA